MIDVYIFWDQLLQSTIFVEGSPVCSLMNIIYNFITNICEIKTYISAGAKLGSSKLEMAPNVLLVRVS